MIVVILATIFGVCSLICAIGFYNGYYNQSDVVESSTTTQLARCDICDTEYPSQRAAIEHMREAHNAPGSDADIKELVMQ